MKAIEFKLFIRLAPRGRPARGYYTTPRPRMRDVCLVAGKVAILKGGVGKENMLKLQLSSTFSYCSINF